LHRMFSSNDCHQNWCIFVTIFDHPFRWLSSVFLVSSHVVSHLNIHLMQSFLICFISLFSARLMSSCPNLIINQAGIKIKGEVWVQFLDSSSPPWQQDRVWCVSDAC
jgi:hypothetical protein